mmetsp:Transcript_5862/g.9383  ORF Transcript_5862/g.9383 Transcript_5862/m.9383 type:complete len:323 (-) Transcript_5862:280-1248(-)
MKKCMRLSLCFHKNRIFFLVRLFLFVFGHVKMKVLVIVISCFILFVHFLISTALCVCILLLRLWHLSSIFCTLQLFMLVVREQSNAVGSHGRVSNTQERDHVSDPQRILVLSVQKITLCIIDTLQAGKQQKRGIQRYRGRHKERAIGAQKRKQRVAYAQDDGDGDECDIGTTRALFLGIQVVENTQERKTQHIKQESDAYKQPHPWIACTRRCTFLVFIAICTFMLCRICVYFLLQCFVDFVREHNYNQNLQNEIQCRHEASKIVCIALEKCIGVLGLDHKREHQSDEKNQTFPCKKHPMKGDHASRTNNEHMNQFEQEQNE